MQIKINLWADEPKNHVVFFSGGLSSFSVADYVKRMYPNDNIVLLFTDTQWEHPDLYRFLHEGADKLELPLLTLSIGLNPIQLMFRERVVYNSRIGNCSKILKMKTSMDYMKKGIKPKIFKWRNQQYLKNQEFRYDATVYFGISWDEAHREKAIRENWHPFSCKFPLIDNCIDNEEVLRLYNIKRPILYDLGFSHNNCMGRCVKAGAAHYKLLKEKLPEVFQKTMEQEFYMSKFVSSYLYMKRTPLEPVWGFNEDAKERELKRIEDAYRDYFDGKTDKPEVCPHPAMSATVEHMVANKYSFMKKQIDGEVYPYQLRDLQYKNVKLTKRIGNNVDKVELPKDDTDKFDIGGCGCMFDFGEDNMEKDLLAEPITL